MPKGTKRRIGETIEENDPDLIVYMDDGLDYEQAVPIGFEKNTVRRRNPAAPTPMPIQSVYYPFHQNVRNRIGPSETNKHGLDVDYAEEMENWNEINRDREQDGAVFPEPHRYFVHAYTEQEPLEPGERSLVGGLKRKYWNPRINSKTETITRDEMFKKMVHPDFPEYADYLPTAPPETEKEREARYEWLESNPRYRTLEKQREELVAKNPARFGGGYAEIDGPPMYYFNPLSTTSLYPSAPPLDENYPSLKRHQNRRRARIMKRRRK